ncbi:MAG TPA: endonuclease V [Candidatus Dormibacteraeota bacterium]|nr:endonuclease V [Candidatus Dormibacteraeota bacterium]
MASEPGPGWWPESVSALIEVQRRLAMAAVEVGWRPGGRPPAVAGVFAVGPRGVGGSGRAGDPGWAAAVVRAGSCTLATATVRGRLHAPYVPGLLALREGPLLERALRALPRTPEVVLVDATGRDHPRRAGLALHLGAAMGLPSIGVTDRTLVAVAPDPGPEAGAVVEVRLDGELVGYRLRARAGVRPIVVHAGWQVSAEVALEVVRGLIRGARTPEPLRQARRLARTLRADDGGAPGA